MTQSASLFHELFECLSVLTMNVCSILCYSTVHTGSLVFDMNNSL